MATSSTTESSAAICSGSCFSAWMLLLRASAEATRAFWSAPR
jgi:hypothetical protein